MLEFYTAQAELKKIEHIKEGHRRAGAYALEGREVQEERAWTFIAPSRRRQCFGRRPLPGQARHGFYFPLVWGGCGRLQGQCSRHFRGADEGLEVFGPGFSNQRVCLAFLVSPGNMFV